MSAAEPVIAVTGLDCRDNPHPGVAIARALRAARGRRVTLVGLAYDPTLTGAFRRDVFDAVRLVPYPSDPPAATERRLLEIRAECRIDGVIPALDSEVPVYAVLAARLAAAGVRTFLPRPAAVKARFKDRLESFCRRHSIAVPRTEVVVDPLRAFEPGGVPLPCFVKGPLADAVLARDAGEAISAWSRIAAKWGFPVLAQAPVNGEEIDVCAVAREGEVLGLVTMKKAAQSAAGKAVAGVIIDDPEIGAEARRIVRALQWDGPLELELIREWSSGRLFLLEVNARLPAWCAVTPSAGVNLPDLVLAHLLGEAAPAPASPTAGTLFVRTSRTTLSDVDLLGRLQANAALEHAADARLAVGPPEKTVAR